MPQYLLQSPHWQLLVLHLYGDADLRRSDESNLLTLQCLLHSPRWQLLPSSPQHYSTIAHLIYIFESPDEWASLKTSCTLFAPSWRVRESYAKYPYFRSNLNWEHVSSAQEALYQETLILIALYHFYQNLWSATKVIGVLEGFLGLWWYRCSYL